jgi:hypothetical protein
MYHYRIVGTPIYPRTTFRDCAVLAVLTGSPPFPLRTSGIVPLSPYQVHAYQHRGPIPEVSLSLYAARYARGGE